MNKLLRFSLLSTFLFLSATALHAQSTLIHYWNFNTLAGPYTHPNIPPIPADFTVITPADSAYLEYYLLPGTSATWGSTNNDGGAQLDNVASTDTTNLRQGALSGLGLRTRNPVDSSELHWHIPSTGFKNLVIKFATQSSSVASGDSAQLYSYSVDGGKTWRSAGMTVNGAPGNTLDLTQGTTYISDFGLVTVTFGSDTTVNNNPNLIFRINCVGNTSKTSGNNRYDDFTLDGDPTGSTPPPSLVLMYYWNFNGLTTTYTIPNIPNFPPDFSVFPNDTGYLQYYVKPGTPSGYSYVDGYPETTPNWQGNLVDTFNARLGAVPGVSFRARNPVDSTELRWHIPTTGYTGILIKYALQSSSTANGDSTQHFSYSIDGGATWDSTDLTVNGLSVDTLNTTATIYAGDSSWGLVTVTLGSNANNNANLIFRIIATGNASHTSGNLRYDNFTVEGMGAGGGGGSQPGKITVTSPLYGNIFVPGEIDTVKFTTVNTVGEVRTIWFSPDSGQNWSQIGTVSGGTSFVVTVPNIATSEGLIRVTADTNVTGISHTFIIYPVTSANRLVHYWDFSNLPTSGYHNPGIPNVKADFSATPTPGLIEYVLEPGTSSTYAGYLDPVPGDTVNNRLNSPPIDGLRVRNPTDSMELRLALPTTGYKGISISYALQASSSTGPQVEKFDYSTNGGTDWTTAGLTVNGATQDTLNVLDTIPPNDYQAAVGFGHVTIGFGSETSMDNNSNFIFRIKFGDTATGGTSGNNRFDNISVDAQQALAGVNQTAPALDASVYPTITPDQISILSPEGRKHVTITDNLGRTIADFFESDRQYDYGVSGLASGTYFIHIQAASGAQATLRFVKE